MKKNIQYIVLILCALCFSCKKAKMDERIIKATLPVFKEVVIESTFNVFLTQDTVYSMKIIADESFIDDVVYEVRDSVLSVRVDSKRLWLKPQKNKISIFINCDSLRLLTVNESSMIQTLNPIVAPEFGMIMSSKLNEANLDLACKVFYYWNIHPCGGKIILNGEVEYLKLWNVGLMEVDANNLVASWALVENKSKAPCRLNIKDRLEYSIFGEGDIFLKGNPTEVIEKDVSSTGKLVIVN